jgi:hypothetical protein
MDVSEKLKITFQFEDSSVKHEIDMNLGASKKLKI